ncbi:hypothetical protein AwWohl_14510 [Gammaproteobacteria bacterium]|nr:hypothetical protein AwWohl_14510 [Gammaproteobacteria bacterium]
MQGVFNATDLVFDTAIKNWQDPLNALRAVAEYIVPEKDLVAAE